MDSSHFDRQALVSGAQTLGVNLSDAQASQLIRYCELVAAANEHINLTRIPPTDYVTHHLLDSLAIARVVNPADGTQLLDAGTGAGFPGVVLAIAYPSLSVLMVDSTRKKLTFIESALQELGINNAYTLHARLEDLGKSNEYRKQFPLITARALASLSELAPLLLPLVAPGGKIIAYKGPGAKDEIAAAESSLRSHHGRVQQCDEFILPGTSAARALVVIESL